MTNALIIILLVSVVAMLCATSWAFGAIKGYDEGRNAGEDVFSWNVGFNEGYAAGKKEKPGFNLKEWDRGFDAGWDALMDGLSDGSLTFDKESNTLKYTGAEITEDEPDDGPIEEAWVN